MPSIFFDKADRTLLKMVNATIDNPDSLAAHSFDPYLHPHGIIELVTTHEFRIAHAAIRLLGSLEAGQIEDRLSALRTLHDEVMHSARTKFRYNTGRVLLQLMKDIVRTQNDPHAQLKLMHGFRSAAGGNPRIVRRFMEQCHLLEMPEECNQLTVDYHVHDANTKGRKNPTHLIMDAWIKGIRYLSVIYYNFLDPQVARELLRAAEIMGITVRIGLEFWVPFRNRFVKIIWTPRGFPDTESFLAFLDEKPTRALMAEGRKATAWVETQIVKTLERWNSEHRFELAKQLNIDLPPTGVDELRAHVRNGQASVLHLAEAIHRSCLLHLKQRVELLREEYRQATEERRKAIAAEIQVLDNFLPENILKTWLTAERNPELACLETPCDDSGMPEIMRLPPEVLLDWLAALRAGYRITLQLANLTADDVLELLWDGQGLITHLELFNLKEWQDEHLRNLHAINRLQRAINTGSTLYIKRILLGMIRRLRAEGDEERCAKFETILKNVVIFAAPYKNMLLHSHIGTDSTSNSNFRHGMGLAVLDTLPARTRKALKHSKSYKPIKVPVHVEVAETKSWDEPPRLHTPEERLVRLLRKLPGLSRLGMQCRTGWQLRTTTIDYKRSNITTMGGGHTQKSSNGFSTENSIESKPKHTGLDYLNGTLLCWIKILIGFVLAQWAFWYTDEWWFLVLYGALIWFFITFGRNIIQAVVSGGGLTRSMLTWREYVSWQRVSDSLFYTGVSVPLLEVFIRRWLLQDSLDLTVANHPLIVYTVIATCNGVYISAHNIIRGFPRQAVIGNLFRSAFAVPLSYVLGALLFETFAIAGVQDPMMFTQNCAAITSKVASDIVAAVIEGIADSNQNRRLRLWDYSTKLQQVFSNFTEISTLFPNTDIMKLMGKPSEYVKFMQKHAPDQLRLCAINALDLMYFWLYQPYAQPTVKSIICNLSMDERLLLIRAHGILSSEKYIGSIMIDGVVGQDFSAALAFYLSHHKSYIRHIKYAYDKSRHFCTHKTTGFDVNRNSNEWIDRSIEERM